MTDDRRILITFFSDGIELGDDESLLSEITLSAEDLEELLSEGIIEIDDDFTSSRRIRLL